MVPLFPLSGFVDLWLGRFGIAGACRAASREPHHRQPDCSAIELISCLRLQLQCTNVLYPGCADSVVAVVVPCRGQSWPAVRLGYPFKFS